MHPYNVKLSYNNAPWLTVSLEVGPNEIGDADQPDFGLAPDIAEMFEAIDLPKPDPIPLMPLHHQIAQKLHAISCTGSKRAHDLIDLQLIAQNSELNYPLIKKTCERLFLYRRMQEWPPIIAVGEGWSDLYAEQMGSLMIFDTVEEATAWANGLISAIDAS